MLYMFILFTWRCNWNNFFDDCRSVRTQLYSKLSDFFSKRNNFEKWLGKCIFQYYNVWKKELIHFFSTTLFVDFSSFLEESRPGVDLLLEKMVIHVSHWPIITIYIVSFKSTSSWPHFWKLLADNFKNRFKMNSIIFLVFQKL